MQGGIPPCIADSHPYRVTSARCRINRVVSPDDGHTVARNMYRKEINILRKILHQFGFIYKIIQGCTVNKTQIYYITIAWNLGFRLMLSAHTTLVFSTCISHNILAPVKGNSLHYNGMPRRLLTETPGT